MHFAMINRCRWSCFPLPMIAELVKKGNRVRILPPRYKVMVDIGADYREVRSALTKDGQGQRHCH